MDDLESGYEIFSHNLKKIATWYRNNKKTLRTFIFSFLVLTISIIIKKGYSNFESAIEAGTAISMDEGAYIPFQLGEFRTNPEGDSRELIIKDSLVNRRMQVMNIEIVNEGVREFLLSSGNICVHAKHFGVPYDIVVFPNQTIINPHIISQGQVWRNIPEVNLEGDEVWKKRATSVYVKFYNSKLEQVYDTLWYDQAYCLAHYII